MACAKEHGVVAESGRQHKKKKTNNSARVGDGAVTSIDVKCHKQQLEDVGFTVMRQCSPCGEKRRHIDADMHKASGKNKQFQQIFNSFERDGSPIYTPLRLQCPVQSDQLKAMLTRDVAKIFPDGDTIPRSPVYLARKPGCQPQSWHRDAHSGYFAVWPLTHNYATCAVPESQKTDPCSPRQDAYDVDRVEVGGCVKVVIEPGDVLVADAKLVHAGGEATKGGRIFPGTPFDTLSLHVCIESAALISTKKRVIKHEPAFAITAMLDGDGYARVFIAPDELMPTDV